MPDFVSSVMLEKYEAVCKNHTMVSFFGIFLNSGATLEKSWGLEPANIYATHLRINQPNRNIDVSANWKSK